MGSESEFEIFVVTAPGLEDTLRDEAKAKGFVRPRVMRGAVAFQGSWPEVRRANLELRGAVRVLARIGAFRAVHLAQLDKRARGFPWLSILRRDVPVKVEASCTRSRIYHSGAAAQRIAKAVAEELGVAVTEDAEVVIKARIEDDLCTLSVDTSGETLHKRGHKEAIAKAPMRETMASLFLMQCGFKGDEAVLDPMCGSGTFVIEAAEIAAGLKPGRSRRFAFELLANHDAATWDRERRATATTVPAVSFFGSDRDAGAITSARANARRAGVENLTTFATKSVSDITPPEGPPGLIICNPPYGTRIGDKKPLFALYGAFGTIIMGRFQGWRIGLVTSDDSLARATGLPLKANGKPVLHGGLRIKLFTTGPIG